MGNPSKFFGKTQIDHIDQFEMKDIILEEYLIIEPEEDIQNAQNIITHINKPKPITNNAKQQLDYDIDMLARAIVQYGKSEFDKSKAHTLLRSILLIYFGDISYRDKRDQEFHSLNQLNSYTELESFPIAAVFLHGSRVLIEFSTECSDELIQWLIPNEACWRYAATHGIKKINEEQIASIKSKPTKLLQEIKIDLIQAAGHAVYKALGNKSQHFGIDIALGGAGNINPFSNNEIKANGEHGHLYVHSYTPEAVKTAGILINIEQSAPYKYDQSGTWHDVVSTKKNRSASGGDFFCKEGALKNLPIASYYDSFWNAISNDTFSLIKTAYTKLIIVINLLSLNRETEIEVLNLIKEIVSSSGNATKESFDNLFSKYYAKTTQYKSQEAIIKALQEKIAMYEAMGNVKNTTKPQQSYF